MSGGVIYFFFSSVLCKSHIKNNDDDQKYFYNNAHTHTQNAFLLNSCPISLKVACMLVAMNGIPYEKKMNTKKKFKEETEKNVQITLEKHYLGTFERI